MTSTTKSSAELRSTETKFLDEAEARQLIQVINLNAAEIGSAIVALYNGQAWKALGYANWRALANAEFGMVRLPKAGRREAVRVATLAGVSGKSIADALGVSMGTVSTDKAALDLSDAPITGTDGRETISKASKKTPKSHAETLKLSLDSLAAKFVAVTKHVTDIEVDQLKGIRLSNDDLAPITQARATVTDLLDALDAKIATLSAVGIVGAPRTKKPTAGTVDAKAIREWATANGIDVSARGRVPANVQDAYDAAHAGAHQEGVSATS